MIAFRKDYPPEQDETAHEFCIQLNVPAADREDAWEIWGIMERLGGVEVSDCCFAFATEQQRMMALETLGGQFGAQIFRNGLAAASSRGPRRLTIG